MGMRVATYPSLIVLIWCAGAARIARGEAESSADAVLAEIRQLMADPPVKTDRTDYMTVLAGRREKVVKLVDSFLDRHPRAEQRDELLDAKLRSMYVVAVVRAAPLDSLRAEAERILSLEPSHRLADYAAYLVMQVKIAEHRKALRRQSLATRPSASGGGPTTLSARRVTTAEVISGHDRFALQQYEEYLRGHRKSRFAPALLAELIEGAWERSDTFSARKHLAQLETDHPDHVETKRILAARRRRQAVGKPISLTLEDLDGKAVDVETMRGKVVLVVFWASWSRQCRETMPRLRSMGRRLGSRGLRIVGVSLDDSRSAVTDFIKRESINWPQHFDGRQWDGDLPKRFGVRSLPTILVIDRSGTLHATGGREVLAGVESLLGRAASRPNIQNAQP